MHSFHRFLAIPLALVLAGSAVVAFAGAPASLVVGQEAPDFELVDQNGRTHRLHEYRGKVVVLEWTNPTCPFVQRHYREGHTTMLDLQSGLDPEKVAWLAIDSSKFVTPSSAQAWVKEKKIPYPVLLDPTGSVGRLYGARTTPHMFVIGTDGTLLYQGAIDDDPRGQSDAPTNYVAAALEAVLSGKPVLTASTKPYGCSVKYAPEGSPDAR